MTQQSKLLSGDTPNSSTEILTDYITQTLFSELPVEVVEKAKLLLLDSIGCGLGGSGTDLGQTAVKALSQQSSGDAVVLGIDATVSIGTAAFLNATLINALDYDESSPGGHLSSTLVGTLLALSNTPGITGRDLLLSYVIGFEVCTRIAVAGQPSAERFVEVWGLGTNQTFGAVAAAAKVLQLDKEQTLNAMGIAGASAPVPSGQKWGWSNRPLTWMKDAVALPAQIGVMSTTLAEAGFKGCRDILDGPMGFWRMAASDQCDFEVMTRALGSKYYISDASFKTYSCCWFIHPTLDAIKSIVDIHDLVHHDIAQIDVWSLTDLAELFDSTKPEFMVDAQFSLPYCVAVLLLGVESGPKWFNQELFSNDQVLSIGSRVILHADSRADEIFHTEDRRISAKVTITTTGGDRYEQFAPAPRGSPTCPITEDEVFQKYYSLAAPVLGPKKAEELKQFVLRLDCVEQVSIPSNLISI